MMAPFGDMLNHDPDGSVCYIVNKRYETRGKSKGSSYNLKGEFLDMSLIDEKNLSQTGYRKDDLFKMSRMRENHVS